jgi:glycosyltransferase involved in cell wall biosynthesis
MKDQQQLFFSIIIPAHNEEKYIQNTLEKIIHQDYPTDRFESFVIENGSKDRTYEIAKQLEGKNVSVFASTEKGVSLARNFGIEKVSEGSDWTIFLDADTLLEKNFLKDLSSFLQGRKDRGYTIGTTSVRPFPNTLNARCWFAFWDLCHRLFKVSFAIQITKSSLLHDIKYDTHLEMAEDLKFIKDARKFGKFFFFSTKEVLSSTRRFEQVGWWKLFFQWTFVGILPKFLQKKFIYKTTR